MTYSVYRLPATLTGTSCTNTIEVIFLTIRHFSYALFKNSLHYKGFVLQNKTMLLPITATRGRLSLNITTLGLFVFYTWVL